MYFNFTLLTGAAAASAAAHVIVFTRIFYFFCTTVERTRVTLFGVLLRLLVYVRNPFSDTFQTYTYTKKNLHTTYFPCFTALSTVACHTRSYFSPFAGCVFNFEPCSSPLFALAHILKTMPVLDASAPSIQHDLCRRAASPTGERFDIQTRNYIHTYVHIICSESVHTSVFNFSSKPIQLKETFLTSCSTW